MRDKQARWIEEQKVQVRWLTDNVRARADELSGLLSVSTGSARTFAVDDLRRTYTPDPHSPERWLVTPERAPLWQDFAPPPPTVWEKLQKSRWRIREAEAKQDYARAVTEYEQREAHRTAALAQDMASHEAAEAARREQMEQYNAAVGVLARGVDDADPDSVAQVAELFMTSADLPEGISTDIRVAYVTAPRRLLVVRQLPDVTVIPAEREFRYVRARDEIVSTARSLKERRERYADLIAQLVLLVTRDAFALLPLTTIDEVAVSGVVAGRNTATGQPEDKCLISVSVTREQFDRLVLSELDAVSCLKHLNALVSPHPWDHEPIRPLFDPDLSRYKIDAASAMSGVDHRTVLTELAPIEFERLIRELFEAIGMEAWATQGSRDDGVDAVAVNRDPIMGGVCVIQAKRYTKVVEIEAVRALAGVMEDMRASRGVLVTTAYFGKASYDFVGRHGKIQLIEGPELKHLIAEHLGIDVVIGHIRGAPRRWTAN
ncbi:restriction endonuclease [Nocardia australiensis]|uniref:restriction endonuclease n=1 Tax=Nocardia australiensis TaxID=2887191 RepID=UPI001D1535FC|nr:restriction endonuclease [Nocardia australiensis]